MKKNIKRLPAGQLALILTLILFAAVPARAADVTVRVKDIARVLEARSNQIMGFGLVVGLHNTGDSSRTGFTEEALASLLQRMGVTLNGKLTSRNIASVMVTADLPAFAKNGSRLDIVVSSMGDATSLDGGTLLMTPLQGPDGQVYAVAQGPISVRGYQEEAPAESLRKNQATVGRIPGGALVEKEVAVTVADPNYLTLVLDQPDFTTASRLAYSLKKNGIDGAKAVDASTIKIPVSQTERADIVDYLAKIEETTLTPDTAAKVVINERTGTVVIGSGVKLLPVAVTHGSITVRIGSQFEVSQPEPFSGGQTVVTPIGSQIDVQEQKGKLVELEPQTTLGSLVKALNAIGASPQDLIAILQAIKAAGALPAEIELI